MLIRKGRVISPNIKGEIFFFSTEEMVSNDDRYLLSSLWPAMYFGEDIHIEGRVSKGLISNLGKFQDKWTRWRKNLSKVKISADQEIETKYYDRVISAYSGGLDSSFTLEKHKPCKAVFIDGWDTGRRSVEKINKIRGFAGADRFVLLITNARNFIPKGCFEDAHGVLLAAALSCFPFKKALIPSSFARNPGFIWGSNPETDPLLGSDNQKIEHCDLGLTRTEKVMGLSSVDHLHVCNKSNLHNCGRCMKCKRTRLNLLLAGEQTPDIFAVAPGLSMQRRKMGKVDRFFFEEIRADAMRFGFSELISEL